MAPPPTPCAPYSTTDAAQSGAPSSRLYVSPASTAPVHHFLYAVDDGLPHTDIHNPPEPTQCCDLCAGAGSRTLYADIARTTPSGCSAFFMQFAIGEGWICQFYGEADVAPVTDGANSTAYLPPTRR